MHYSYLQFESLAEAHYDESPYVYCGNDPVNKVDPLGLDWYYNDPNEFPTYIQGDKDYKNYKYHSKTAVRESANLMYYFGEAGSIMIVEKVTGDAMTYLPETVVKPSGGGYTDYNSYSYGSLNEMMGDNQGGGSGNWLKTTSDAFAAAGIGGTVKTELIDFAVRDYAGLSRKSFEQLSNYSKMASEVRVLGTAGTKYLKFSKGLGVVGNVVGVTSAGVQLIQNPTLGNTTRLAVQGAAIGAAFIPVVGWGVSLGIGVADLIWGDDFYKWIDEH